jgi:hypothetical protein
VWGSASIGHVMIVRELLRMRGRESRRRCSSVAACYLEMDGFDGF